MTGLYSSLHRQDDPLPPPLPTRTLSAVFLLQRGLCLSWEAQITSPGCGGYWMDALVHSPAVWSL